MCTLEKRGDFFILTLTGEDSGSGADQHRFNPEAIASILSALSRAKSQAKGGSVLITTSRGKFFSNGFDLAWARSAGSPDSARDRLRGMVDSFRQVAAALFDLPMPTVAALNGHAAAAGFALALCHDYVVMRRDRGFLYMSEVDLGLSMPDYFAALFRAKIGSSLARRDVLLGGKKMTADEAVRMGIVDSAQDREEGVQEAAMHLGEQLAKRRWDGEVYAEIRKELYPELRGMLRLGSKAFATPKL